MMAILKRLSREYAQQQRTGRERAHASELRCGTSYYSCDRNVQDVQHLGGGATHSSADKAPRVGVLVWRQAAWKVRSPQAVDREWWGGGEATYDEDGNADEEAEEKGTQQVLSVLQLLKVDWCTHGVRSPRWETRRGGECASGRARATALHNAAHGEQALTVAQERPQQGEQALRDVAEAEKLGSEGQPDQGNPHNVGGIG